MSRETANVETEPETEEGFSVLELWQRWYDLPVLAVLAGFMLYVRMQAYDRFVRGGEVLFAGNDAYYHYRQVSYSVRNWPFTMSFDPWTRFPYGTGADHFGTLFDQIIATAALVVGLGSPSDQTIATVTLVAPAVMGALLVVPVYLVGRRLGGRSGGLFGALVLALLPGTILQRTNVGFSDHHVAEMFFGAFALAGMMAALAVARRESPVYEQVLDRDWEGLRPVVVWSALAGFALAMYMWAWPPGVLFVGIFGIYFVVAFSVDYLRGESPEYLGFVGAISSLVAVPLLLVKFDTLAVGTTSISPLQILLTLGLGVGTVFLAFLARYFERSGLDGSLTQRLAYPGTVLAIAVVSVAILAVVLPGLFKTIQNNALRVFAFGQGKGTLTITEAQSVPGIGGPLLDWDLGLVSEFMYREYGLAYFSALIAMGALLVHPLYAKYRAEFLLVAVWSFFALLMALTQVRFNYYLAISVAVLNAWLFGQVARTVGIPSLDQRLSDVKGYQVLALLAVFMLVIAPLAPPLAAASAVDAQQQNIPQFVVDAGERTGPGGSAVIWSGSANWMEENTPREGNYGGVGNDLDYYGSYGRTDDFDYPEGAYGVMAWWDYGHWITVLGERIPHANPFQQNARSASSFFQAQTETRANLILEALPNLVAKTGDRIDELSNEQLRGLTANQSDAEDHEDVQYVMIDDQTAGGKFNAVAQWAGPGQSAYFTSQPVSFEGQSFNVPYPSDRYRDSIVSELYFEDASGLSHYRLVRESSRYSIIAPGGYDLLVASGGGLQFRRGPTRLSYDSWNQQAQNLSRTLSQIRRANAGENKSLYSVSRGAYVYNAHLESSLKTFERVPGATIEGRIENFSKVPATLNGSVSVSLRLRTHTGRPFTYSQSVNVSQDGTFSVTVPYATNDEVAPPEGGTNTSVRAAGNYSLRLGPLPLTSFNVSESAVYEGATIDGVNADVGQFFGNQTDGNQTDGNESGSLVAPLDGDDVSAPSLAGSPDAPSGATTPLQARTWD